MLHVMGIGSFMPYEITSSLIKQASLLSIERLIYSNIMLKYTSLIKRLACIISNAYQWQ